MRAKMDGPDVLSNSWGGDYPDPLPPEPHAADRALSSLAGGKMTKPVHDRFVTLPLLKAKARLDANLLKDAFTREKKFRETVSDLALACGGDVANVLVNGLRVVEHRTSLVQIERSQSAPA